MTGLEGLLSLYCGLWAIDFLTLMEKNSSLSPTCCLRDLDIGCDLDLAMFWWEEPVADFAGYWAHWQEQDGLAPLPFLLIPPRGSKCWLPSKHCKHNLYCSSVPSKHILYVLTDLSAVSYRDITKTNGLGPHFSAANFIPLLLSQLQ